MDDWKDIDEELKEFEESLLPEDEVLRRLVTPSAADYWKKRIDEEKTQFSKILETRDEEKKATDTELNQTKAQIKELRQKVKELEDTLKSETSAWEDKLKASTLEMQFEKERISFGERIRELEYEKRSLTEEIDGLKKEMDMAKANLEAGHKSELHELLFGQKEIIGNLNMIDRDMEACARELRQKDEEIERYKHEVSMLSQQNSALNDEVKNTLARTEYEKARSLKHKEELFDYLHATMGYYSGNMQGYLGTILGIVGFCAKKIRMGLLGRNIIVKRQLAVIESIISDVLLSLERLMCIMSRKTLELQEVSIEKLAGILGITTGTSKLPVGLKTMVDLGAFTDIIKKYSCKALLVFTEFQETLTGSNVLLAMNLSERVALDEDFISLKNIVYLHGWSLKLENLENRDVIIIEIKIM